MQIVHHLPVKNRRPMISLHVVSGPWTSFVVAIEKGRFNIAVCRRYKHFFETLIKARFARNGSKF
jgi:hypothetical protein